MKNAIVFKDFTFRYQNQEKPTLKNINLSIKEGEKVLIAGPSGSGKSTLGSCLNGLVPFSVKGEFEGSLILEEDLEPRKASIFEISKYIGTVLQDQDGQFIGLSVGEDVSFIDENDKVCHEQMLKNTKEALELVNMQKSINFTPKELSGGQKQCVSLAGIMRSSAKILLFDEPLANLDPLSGKNAMELIANIQEKTKKTVLVIEHRIEDVLEQDFDRIIIINDGEVVANGTPLELFQKDCFGKNGLREPLYIEALKYANIDISSIDVYPIEKIKTKEIQQKIKTWCESVEFKSKTFDEKILEAKDLVFSYVPSWPILKGLSFDLKKGEILALLGNNGAGKSTLCKLITGIQKQISGEIYFKNQNIKDESIRQRGEKIGYVMQNPNHMLSQETLLKEVEFGLKIRKIKDYTQKAYDALKICELYQFRNWPLASLSYGQKKRLSIATILALEPEVIFLDEPTAGQDHLHYTEFMEFVKKISDKGVSIVLITHDMHLSLEYADRAIVLYDGKISANASPSLVLHQKELIAKAHLKQTSLSKMAELLDLDSKILMNSFIGSDNKEGCSKKQDNKRGNNV